MNDTNQEGITLRDEFAIAAMKAILQAANDPRYVEVSVVAKLAYKIADAMLVSRNNKD